MPVMGRQAESACLMSLLRSLILKRFQVEDLVRTDKEEALSIFVPVFQMEGAFGKKLRTAPAMRALQGLSVSRSLLQATALRFFLCYVQAGDLLSAFAAPTTLWNPKGILLGNRHPCPEQTCYLCPDCARLSSISIFNFPFPPCL